MATHSSILAWEIPWTEEPDGLHTVHGVEKTVGQDLAKQLNNNNINQPAGESHSQVQSADIRIIYSYHPV